MFINVTTYNSELEIDSVLAFDLHTGGYARCKSRWEDPIDRSAILRPDYAGHRNPRRSSRRRANSCDRTAERSGGGQRPSGNQLRRKKNLCCGARWGWYHGRSWRGASVSGGSLTPQRVGGSGPDPHCLGVRVPVPELWFQSTANARRLDTRIPRGCRSSTRAYRSARWTSRLRIRPAKRTPYTVRTMLLPFLRIHRLSFRHSTWEARQRPGMMSR